MKEVSPTPLNPYTRQMLYAGRSVRQSPVEEPLRWAATQKEAALRADL
ncbi:hypothetical protein [Chlorogloeopsis sp. ULAP02]